MKGVRGNAPRGVTTVEEALNQLSQNLMQVTSQHHHSGFTSIRLGDPSCSGAQLFQSMQKLITIQRKSCHTRTPPPMEECREPFLAWLESHGVALADAAYELRHDLPEGSGLVATRAIEEGERFLEVPARVMITMRTAENSIVERIPADPIKKMPSVKLATWLVLERNQSQSPWLPYLDVMPRTLSLPLFWEMEDLAQLQGTSSYGAAIQQVVNTIMQYFHIRQAMQSQNMRKPLQCFTFEEYRWAVGIVMSRQNLIPVNGTPQITLVPLWDMINHDEGVFTTYYHSEDELTQCTAMRPFAAGEQIYMYYGPRPNSMFLQYQGFLFPRNAQRTFTFHHNVISEADKFKAAKKVFLMKQELSATSLSVEATNEDVSQWRSMVALRTGEASPQELREQNGLEAPLGVELSLTNELAATQTFLDALARIQQWKADQRALRPPREEKEGEEASESGVVSMAFALQEEEDQTLATGVQLVEAYRAKLRKREKRSKQKAKKKEETVLQTACSDLD